ncbi:sensor histidine kinase [Nocardia uniformis]|uniref:histidine kinase n=1 Tax=Nocardia uniformis TaxID=53432 RepID=A0A849BUS5_9NOCA|nr:sensor histidine kinase [Nocardia uniformis]NNH69934.1 sensor histidine kinase [Nocardia uniformis]
MLQRRDRYVGLLSPRLRRILVDLGFGLVVTTAVVMMTLLAGPDDGSGRPDAVSCGLALALGTSMLVRRRWPVATLLFVGVGLAAFYVHGYPPVGIAVPMAAALFTAAQAGHLRVAVTGAVGLTAFMTTRQIWDSGTTYVLWYELFTALILMQATIAAGDTVRSRRGWQREAAKRAELMLVEQEHEAQRRVEQERVRIAREVHDVIAHTLTVISVQSSVAAEALADADAAPPVRQADAAIGTIRQSSREALRELRSTLGTLRLPDGQPRTPLAGLQGLRQLITSTAESGLTVDLDVVGEARPVPVIVESAVHRIVQEALTNVLRHAHADTATVRIRYTPETLEILVTDNGRSTSPAQVGAGFGIRGMRERVALLGGTFSAGPTPISGFAVSAALPAAASA